MKPTDDPNRQRALRYISRPDLARAKMAPPFAITAIDGRHISMDDLQGKVVLVDFWATWCAPCREALPHIREVAKKFQGQPLVILSVSLDTDEQPRFANLGEERDQVQRSVLVRGTLGREWVVVVEDAKVGAGFGPQIVGLRGMNMGIVPVGSSQDIMIGRGVGKRAR